MAVLISIGLWLLLLVLFGPAAFSLTWWGILGSVFVIALGLIDMQDRLQSRKAPIELPLADGIPDDA